MKSPAPFLNRLAAALTAPRLASFNLPRPAVSFSFDDFPGTALHNGGRILESYGLRGTYYVSCQLCGSESVSGRVAGDEDIAACIERSHELACHTYDHINCLHRSPAHISDAIQKNQEVIRSAFGATLMHFAYPYGAVSPAAKKTALRHYQSARTTQPGVNRGAMDLGMLKATALYSRRNAPAWQSYLHELRAKPGWLIFYTHDVSPSPSDYGCTPEILQTAIEQARAMGYDILPVGEVVSRLTKTTGS